jgi:hypothetical protein
MTFEEFKTHLQALVTARSRDEVDSAIKAATPSGYYSTLEVPWDYWHFGAHADNARAHGMPLLAELYSAAWQMYPRVLEAPAGMRQLEREAVRERALRQGQAVLTA